LLTPRPWMKWTRMARENKQEIACVETGRPDQNGHNSVAGRLHSRQCPVFTSACDVESSYRCATLIAMPLHAQASDKPISISITPHGRSGRRSVGRTCRRWAALPCACN
jgi:hypothetical protein